MGLSFAHSWSSSFSFALRRAASIAARNLAGDRSKRKYRMAGIAIAAR
jgi:hypothetical protein